MMHKDAMLKFGWLFDLAKEAYRVRQGLVAPSPHIKFGTPSLSRERDVISIFKMAAAMQPCSICFGGLKFKLLVRRINSSGDIAM